MKQTKTGQDFLEFFSLFHIFPNLNNSIFIRNVNIKKLMNYESLR